MGRRGAGPDLFSPHMTRHLWVLLLAAACAAPDETPRPPVLRQANTGLPAGFTGTMLLSPTGGAGDQFGHALAWGDFNCDRVMDLAVGAPGVGNELGNVFV